MAVDRSFRLFLTEELTIDRVLDPTEGFNIDHMIKSEGGNQ